MKWEGLELATYPQIIETALALEGDDQRAFVDAYRNTGPYALQNIGYFAGYYDQEKAATIYRVFGTSHPVFGTHRPTAEEALEAGRMLMTGAAVTPDEESGHG